MITTVPLFMFARVFLCFFAVSGAKRIPPGHEDTKKH
jgi:hypothetical protein